MRHYFFDASAFTKLYSYEPGTERVRHMHRSAVSSTPSSRVIVSELIHPETASAVSQIALGPNAANRGLSKFAARRAFDRMAQDLGPASALVIIGVSGLMASAAQLVWKHRITGADAVHLATALKVRSKMTGGTELHFVGADRRLNKAAADEGFDVIDPTA